MLILALVLTLISLSSFAYSNTWWDDNWPYKQAINLSIATGTTETNHQVRFILNSTDVGANWDWTSECVSDKLRSRFVNEGQNKTLDFWVESCDSTLEIMTVWVEIDKSITTADSQIYIYYGNSGATTKSNGTSTFDFFDDFDGGGIDASVWAGTGAYSVANSKLSVTTGAVYTSSTILNSPINRIVDARAMYTSSSGSYSGVMISDDRNIAGSNGGSDALSMYMTQSSSMTMSRWAADGTASSYNLGNANMWLASLNTNYTIEYKSFEYYWREFKKLFKRGL